MVERICLILFAVVLLNSCSGSNTADKPKETAKPRPNVNLADRSSTNTGTADANSTPAQANSNVALRQRPSANRMVLQPRIDSDPEATPLPIHFKPAPENSEIGVSMNRDGTISQIRLFKDHPQILKVESTTLGTDESTLRIFLRNGEVSEVKVKGIPNLQSESSAKLLALAGVKPKKDKGDRQRIAN